MVPPLTCEAERAYALCDQARTLRETARLIRAGIHRQQADNPLRRLLWLARGANDDDLSGFRDKALAPLRANPGIWLCVTCWARAAGVFAPEGQIRLRDLARTWPIAAQPGNPVYDAAICGSVEHRGRPHVALCVRVLSRNSIAR